MTIRSLIREAGKLAAMATSSGRLKQFSLMLGLLLIVPLIAFSIVQVNGPEIRKQAFDNLEAIAKLKAEGIENWLAERQLDLEFLAAGEGFAEHAERLALSGNADSRAYVDRRLAAYSKSRYYHSAILLNASGQALSAIGENNDTRVPVTQQLLQTALKSGKIARSDLYLDANTGHAHLDYVLPLRGSGGRPPMVAVLFHIPAANFLFPYIQTWPTPSASAETLLVRRDGNDVLFLNELRHRHGAALSLRLSLGATISPAAAAILSGQAQVIEAVDYRGVPVLAATRPVAGTPWHVVAKIDREEVMAPLKKLIFWVSLLALAAVSAVAMAIFRLWRQARRSQQLELADQAATMQQDSDAKYRRLHESMMDAYVMVDMAGNLIDFNSVYQDMLGYSYEELRGLTYMDLTPEKWRESEARIVAEQVIPHGQSPVYEKEYIREDGSVFPVELRTFLLRGKEGQPEAMWAIVRDLTERRRNEEELKIFFELIPELVCVASTDGRFLKINRLWQETLGYTEAEILAMPFLDLIHPDDREATLCEVERQLAGNATMHFINRYRCKDGSYRWLEWGAAPAVDGKLLFAAGRDITEQKEISAELEERLCQLHETELAMGMAGIGIHRVDATTGRLLYVNDFFCQLHGYTRDELLGMTVLDLNPDIPALPFHLIADPIRQRGRDRFEALHRHKDGHLIPVEITLYYQSHEVDSPGYFVAFTTDISRRKATEERMRLDAEQQTLLRQLLESTLVGGSLEETLDYCLKQLMSLSWLSLLPKGGVFVADQGGQRLRLAVSHNLTPEIEAACTELPYGRCLCGRAAASGKLQYASHVDERHEIAYPGMPDHGHYSLPLVTSGQVVGVLVLYLPPGGSAEPEKERFLSAVANILAGYISRKAGEQALAENQAHLEQTIHERTADLKASEARTRAIVTTMLDSVVHIDTHGIILSVNFAVQEMFGYAEGEMVGRNVSMLMPEPHASVHDGYIARYLQTRQPHVVGSWRETTARHKDGRLFPIELAVNEMVDDAGSTFIGVMRDMTMQKVAEQKVRSALQAAQDAAEAKSNFLANMSHEIRTPLNAVLGLAQIGVRDNHGRETAEVFKRIRDSGSHLLAVVNDILDFSKIEAGKLKIEKRPFALFSVIDNVKSFVSERAEEKGLALAISVSPDLSDWVEGDSLRLAQILTNLLSNAIKFTERGEVMLRVARDGDDIVFMVADSGIGMSEAQLARLFQSFEQADSSTTRHYGGTGLGLAISRNLANLMGGDISVDSRPGAGSSFYLHLPLPAVPAPAHLDQREGAAARTGPRLTGVSVLAADDVDINRFILEDLLTHEGARVAFAEDGQQALDQLDERGVSAFDVVLMDVQMPVMDGLEATRRIAEIAPALPVIGLTAHAMAEEREKCLAAGMVDHVVKPVDIDVLVAAILRQVRLEPQPADIAPNPAAVPAPEGAAFGGCNDPAIIDLAVLASRVGNDPAKIAKYTERFVETTRDTLAEMKAALAARDLPALAGLGHRLKSAALTVGAMRFGKICQELESLKDSNDPAAAQARVEQLDELFEQIAQRAKKVI